MTYWQTVLYRMFILSRSAESGIVSVLVLTIKIRTAVLRVMPLALTQASFIIPCQT